MKGILHKTPNGWTVTYDEVIGENIIKKNQNSLPLCQQDQNPYDGIIDDSQNEGLEVEFEIIEQFMPYDNWKPIHKFAKILTIEEDELKDWDVTLMDGLENEPYISDDFQIGPDGAYEHTDDITPREKASELIVNYQATVKSLDYNEAKQCALVMVDEIKRILYDQDSMTRYDYWFEVKKEIEKL